MRSIIVLPTTRIRGARGCLSSPMPDSRVGPQEDLQPLPPAELEGRPTPGAGQHDELVLAPREGGERRLELHAGERRADAEVDAAPERQVPGVLPARVDDVGRDESPGIPIGGADDERDPRPEGDPRAGDLHALVEDPALEPLERRVEAQDLLDRRTDCYLAGADASPLVGVRGQR